VTSRHHTWEQFQKQFVSQPVSTSYSPSGNPRASIYSDKELGRIGVEVELKSADEVVPIPLKTLALERVHDNGKYKADFWISQPELFEQFYSLATHIVDLVQLHGEPVQQAIEEGIQKIRSLLAMESLLSEEKVIGLWGELWVLRKQIESKGTSAVRYWKGATKAVHDFQFEDIELEVKTTRNERRKHIISSLTQLVPSPGFELYICSLQIEPSSDRGETLPDIVNHVAHSLSGDQPMLAKFESKLELENYSSDDSIYYQSRYYLRSEPALVFVDSQLPKIDLDLLKGKYGELGGQRVDDVSYRLDLTGLELPETSSKYQLIFG